MGLCYEGSVAYIYPEHFDVDLLIGVQNAKGNNWDKLVSICMKTFDPHFARKIKPGDILVGGRNFGYGHAHPQSMETMKKMGISIVLAESFAPAFFRGELGNGRILLKVPDITKKVSRFDRLRVEFDKGIVHNLTTGTVIEGTPPSPIALELIKNNGNLDFLKNELQKGVN